MPITADQLAVSECQEVARNAYAHLYRHWASYAVYNNETATHADGQVEYFWSADAQEALDFFYQMPSQPYLPC